MIKIRLEGKPEEVQQVAAFIRTLPAWRVLEESRDYPNRPPSEFVRRYVTVEPRIIDSETGEILI